MIYTPDLKEFFKLNNKTLDRFLRWKQVGNPMDREDILQNFYYELQRRQILPKIDNKYYYLKMLQGMIGRYYSGITLTKQEKYAWYGMHTNVPTYHIDNALVYSTLSDSTSTIENNMMIGHCMTWLGQQNIGPGERKHINTYVNAAIHDKDLNDKRANIAHAWGKHIKRYRNELRETGDIMYKDSEMNFRPRHATHKHKRECAREQPRLGWIKRVQGEYKHYYFSLDLHGNNCIKTNELQPVAA